MFLTSLFSKISGSCLVIFGIICVFSCDRKSADSAKSDNAITAADVTNIEEALKDVDPSSYRLVLPVFKDGKVSGTKTYGSIPLSQVREIAVQQKVDFKNEGNVQIVWGPDGEGQNSGRVSNNEEYNNDGKGPNSMHPTSTGKLEMVLDDILKKIDREQYILLKR